MEDREILALLLARSERALDALRTQYGRLCRRIAMNILHSEPDAEECENDTYLAVWNTVPPAEPDPLTPYVGRIARNLALDRYRYNRAARRYAGEDAPLCEADTFIGIGFHHVILRRFEADIPGMPEASEPMDCVDNWSVGYLRPDGYEVMADSVRTRRHGALETELQVPMYAGALAMCVSDELGRSWYYRLADFGAE